MPANEIVKKHMLEMVVYQLPKRVLNILPKLNDLRRWSDKRPDVRTHSSDELGNGLKV